MTRALLHVLIGISLTAAGTVAGAGEIYRWVDQDGRVHYSQTPPAGRSAQEVIPQPGTRGASFASEGIQAFNAERDHQRSEHQQQQELAAAKAAQEQKSCKLARQNLDTLDARTARRIFTEQPDGSMARLTEEQFQATRQEVLAVIEANC